MKNLFLCKTPYQVLVAVQLVITQFFDDVNDVFIADTIADYKYLCEKVKFAKVFRKVMICSMDIKFKSKMYFIYKNILTKVKIKSEIDEVYDRFFFCNLGKNETILYREVKINSKEVELNMFEDGFSSYSKSYGDFFEKMKYKNSIKVKILYIYRSLIYEAFMKISNFYVFTPELFDWTPSCTLKKIPKINIKEKKQIEIINNIFGYDSAEDKYSESVIFFEESYYADKIVIDDLKFVQEISDIIGISRLIVKIHPRNPENRFSALGIKTNHRTFIPWEVIALNIDLSDKILITIASGSALTSLINTGVKPKKIYMLMNSMQFPDEKLTPTLPVLRKIAKCYPEYIELPESLEIFYENLKECISNGD